jgi:hypothetical protein
MSLTVLEPTPPTRPAPGGKRLAPRLDTLEGKTIALIDGWGRRVGDELHMYPLLAELRRRLEEELGVKQSLWYPKESIAKGLSGPRMTELIARADAAIIGEAI